MCAEIQKLTRHDELKISLLGYADISIVQKMFPHHLDYVKNTTDQTDEESVIPLAYELANSDFWRYKFSKFILDAYFKPMLKMNRERSYYFLRALMLCIDEQKKVLLYNSRVVANFIHQNRSWLDGLSWLSDIREREILEAKIKKFISKKSESE